MFFPDCFGLFFRLHAGFLSALFALFWLFRPIFPASCRASVCPFRSFLAVSAYFFGFIPGFCLPFSPFSGCFGLLFRLHAGFLSALFALFWLFRPTSSASSRAFVCPFRSFLAVSAYFSGFMPGFCLPFSLFSGCFGLLLRLHARKLSALFALFLTFRPIFFSSRSKSQMPVNSQPVFRSCEFFHCRHLRYSQSCESPQNKKSCHSPLLHTGLQLCAQ